jgi:peptide/nickel transport system substrate-binding protein
MIRGRWKGRASATVLVLALLAAGCGSDTKKPDAGDGGAGAPNRGGTLTYLDGGAQPVNFDPGMMILTASGGSNYMTPVFGTLLIEDYQSGEVVPQLAKSLKLAGTDGKTWELTLRPKTVFSDGTPFDAEAVKYNWDRVKTLPTSQNLAAAQEIASLAVMSPTVLRIELSAPDAAFDRVVANNLTFVGSPTAMKADLTGFLSKPVGAGAFTLTSYASSGDARYARNPKYWDAPRPYVDSLVIRRINDDLQRVNTMLTTGAQMADPGTIEQARSLGVSRGMKQLGTAAPGGGSLLMFNANRLPFSDVGFRKAFESAMNRDYILKSGVGANLGRVLPTMFAKSSPFYDAKATMPAFDAKEAQRGFDAYQAEHPGKISLDFPTVSSALGETIQALLKPYGIDVKIRVFDAPAFVPALAGGDFDFTSFRWAASNPLPSFQQYYSKAGRLNFGKYDNPEVDRLIAEAIAAPTANEQTALVRKIQDILVTQDAYAYFLYQAKRLVLHTPKVQGLNFFIDGIWTWDTVWLQS